MTTSPPWRKPSARRVINPEGQSTLFAPASPVKVSARPASGLVLPIPAPVSSTASLKPSTTSVQIGSCWKTSLGFSATTGAQTWLPSWGRWKNSGTGGVTGCSTHNISESPNDVVVSTLSDILETGDLPNRYFLSPLACHGILRRAVKRQRRLPRDLALPLIAIAQLHSSDTPSLQTLLRLDAPKVLTPPSAPPSSSPAKMTDATLARALPLPFAPWEPPTPTATAAASSPSPDPCSPATAALVITTPLTDTSSPMSLTATELMAQDPSLSMVRIMWPRRLTPLECERLMGYPDGWSDPTRRTVPVIVPWVTPLRSLLSTGSPGA